MEHANDLPPERMHDADTGIASPKRSTVRVRAELMRRRRPDVPDLVARLGPGEREKARASADAFVGALVEHVRRRRLVHEFDRRCHVFQSEEELLAALLAVAGCFGIARIRYYHYDERTAELVSINCAGHDADEAVRLRLGNIVRCRADCPPDTSDSFVCIDRGWPVAFRIDPKRTAPMEAAGEVGKLPVLVLARNQCERVLANSPYRLRVDYPLTQGQSVVGKFSCDVEGDELTPALAARLLRFWAVVIRAALPLKVMHANREVRVAPAAEAVRDDVARITSLRELFDYCVTRLPERFGIRHASMFTRSADATGSERLILRRTSYRDSQAFEDGAPGRPGCPGYYELAPRPDNAITAWVAVNRRPVRLQNLNDEKLLRSQLQVLDPNLRWMNKIQDSSGHTSFLAVPVVSDGRVLGVLRFTEKAAGDAQAYFTDIDEKCLLRVAADYIGPRLAELQRSESQRLFCCPELRQTVVKLLTETVRTTASTSKPRPQASFRLAMRKIFREEGAARHLFLLNVIDSAGRFSHLATAGSLAPEIVGWGERLYPLDGTLTGHAYRTKGWVYVQDLDRAREVGMFRPILPQTSSALACPIALGGDRRGVIVLHSDRYDIMPEVYGPLLTYLTNLTTEILSCRCRP